MVQGHAYILASKRNGTLYTGVTNNLSARIYAHLEERVSAFARKYGVRHLVWYETYDMVTDAIQRGRVEHQTLAAALET
jgi:putative endonuclease